MVNKKFCLGILAFVLLFWITVVGCDDGNNAKTYTVTFDADGGNAVIAQPVTENGKVTEPTAPTKANDVAGLYFGTPPDYYTFDGWYNGNAKWDFNTPVTSNITLKAKWTLPVNPIDLTEIEGDNIVRKTFIYIRDNEITETHTLLLDTDIEYPSFLGGFSYNLTIIGLNEERTINTRNVIVGQDGANQKPLLASNLTLGKNININPESYMLWLQSGNLTMQEGSKITGILHCSGGYSNPFSFTMNGGIINGRAYFMMVQVEGEQTFTISGNAKIDELSLNHGYGNSGITVASGWTGSIGKLSINDSSLGGVSFDDYLDYWNDAVVIKAASGYTLTERDVEKIIILGDFTLRETTQSISQTHKLELDSASNVIKLVRK
jgi:uncharacterized repeat protein (TIGR02543 family)